MISHRTIWISNYCKNHSKFRVFWKSLSSLEILFGIPQHIPNKLEELFSQRGYCDARNFELIFTYERNHRNVTNVMKTNQILQDHCVVVYRCENDGTMSIVMRCKPRDCGFESMSSLSVCGGFGRHLLPICATYD